MDRRTALKMLAAAGLLSGPLSYMIGRQAAATTDIGEPYQFSYAWLKGQARHLSEQPYQSYSVELPEPIRNLSWDDYQSIRFRSGESLWSAPANNFRAQMFHLGLFYKTPVKIYEIREGIAHNLGYDAGDFEHDGDLDLEALPADLGYAGFRLQFHTDFSRDFVAFLGASYFRAVGVDMQYGLSARALAINTAVPEQKEEFPEFVSFWLEKPEPGASKVAVYALLDSPSVTGAYAFDLYPGRSMVMEVSAALYPRKPIAQVGFAPLTSMYQVGENNRRMGYDWRPEIHDSDGLSILSGQGEWIWRPLENPRGLRVSSFLDQDPVGFGLLQRDRDFNHYQDDGVFYDRRPSLWVEPRTPLGKGRVVLVEIPTNDETFDNIVAFWQMEAPLQPGREHLLSYKLHWGAEPPIAPYEVAKAVATRTGLGGVVGQKRTYYSRRFAIDFAGGKLGMLGRDAEVEAVITASSGRVEIVSARPLDSIGGYRAMFDLVPEESEEPVDIRLFLRLGNEPLTETWVYQFTPPPMDQRILY